MLRVQKLSSIVPGTIPEKPNNQVKKKYTNEFINLIAYAVHLINKEKDPERKKQLEIELNVKITNKYAGEKISKQDKNDLLLAVKAYSKLSKISLQELDPSLLLEIMDEANKSSGFFSCCLSNNRLNDMDDGLAPTIKMPNNYLPVMKELLKTHCSILGEEIRVFYRNKTDLNESFSKYRDELIAQIEIINVGTQGNSEKDQQKMAMIVWFISKLHISGFFKHEFDSLRLRTLYWTYLVGKLFTENLSEEFLEKNKDSLVCFTKRAKIAPAVIKKVVEKRPGVLESDIKDLDAITSATRQISHVIKEHGFFKLTNSNLGVIDQQASSSPSKRQINNWM